MVAVLTAVMSEQTLLSWGWRIPFMIAGPLGLIGLYIRMKLEETPAFQREAEKAEAVSHETTKQQFRDTLIRQWRPLLHAAAMYRPRADLNVTDYMALSYPPSYLSATLKFNETHGLFIVLVVMVLMMPLTLFAGRLSDRVGRKPVMLAGCVGLLLSIPALSLICMSTIPSIFAGMMILGALLSCFTGVMPSPLPALFPTKIRYGALAIGFNVSVSLFGGTTPLVTAWLVDKTGMLMMPAYYLMGASVIGIVSVLALHETAKKPLKGSPLAVASHSEAQAVLHGHRVASEMEDMPEGTARA